MVGGSEKVGVAVTLSLEVSSPRFPVAEI